MSLARRLPSHPGRSASRLGLLATAVVATLAWAPVSRASGEFVTQFDCDSAVFSSDSSEKRLDVYNDRTTVTAWGSFMDWASSVTSSNSSIRATIVDRATGPENADGGCPNLGSISIRIEPLVANLATSFATLTVHFPIGNDWTLPITMHRRAATIDWAANGPVRDCLRAQNGDLFPTAGRTDELTVEIPRNLAVTSCLRGLEIDAALVPNEFIDARPQSTTWSTEIVAGPANPGPSEGSSGCLRNACLPNDPLRILPRWSELAAVQVGSSRTITADVLFGGEAFRALRVRALGVADVSPIPPPPSVAVAIQSAGSSCGSVTSAPAGIDCVRTAAGTSGTCTDTFPENTTVVLTAANDANCDFASWLDCPGAEGNRCTIDNTVDRNVTVTAQFTRVFRLTVAPSALGSFADARDVAGVPDSGINCGTTCGVSFAEGNRRVRLRASQNAGRTFLRWSAGPCVNSTNRICDFNMNGQHQSLAALFQ